jgi:hypothetical protein
MFYGSGGATLVWLVLMIAIWAVPVILLVWFVRTLNRMSESLRDIAEALRRSTHQAG